MRHMLIVQVVWMLVVCSILLKWQLSKTWVKHYVTTKFPCQAFTILPKVQTKKNWFVLETRKLRMFFVVLCSFPYRVWHLNNVKTPLVEICLCWSQRPVNSAVKSVVDLSFFISRPFIKPVSE